MYMRKKKSYAQRAVLVLGIVLTASWVHAQDTTGKAISPAQFEKRAHKRKVTVLDVRTPEEYAEGHLKNAVLINVMDSTAFVSRVQGLKKNRTYLIYCRSGKRSGKALVMMQEQGFSKLYHMAGGITAWTGPVEKTTEQR
jgi:rhodanese-related sulfurtransferase